MGSGVGMIRAKSSPAVVSNSLVRPSNVKPPMVSENPRNSNKYDCPIKENENDPVAGDTEMRSLHPFGGGGNPVLGQIPLPGKLGVSV